MSDIDTVIYRNIFTRLMEPICIVGTDRIIIDANKSLEIILGLEENSLIGKEIGSFFTEESKKMLDNALKEGNEETDRMIELKLRRNDGTYIHRNIKLFSVKDSDNKDIFCFQIPVMAPKYPHLGDIFDMSGGTDLKGSYDEALSTLQGEIADAASHSSKGIEPLISEAMVAAPIPMEYTQPVPVSVGPQQLVNDIDELLRSLSAWSDEGMVTTDTGGKITSYNDSFREWVGYDPEEIDKKMIVDFLGKDYREDMERIIEGLVKGESVKGIRSELVGKDGSKHFVMVNAMTIKDGKDEISGFIIIMQKTGAMGQQQDYLKLSAGPSLEVPPVVRSVVNLVKEGIVVTNADHNITGLNDAMEEIIGTRSRKRRGKDLRNLFPPMEREWAATIIKNIEEQGEVEKLHVLLLHDNGSSIPANIDGSLIEDPDGGKVGIMLVVRVVVEGKADETDDGKVPEPDDEDAEENEVPEPDDEDAEENEVPEPDDEDAEENEVPEPDDEDAEENEVPEPDDEDAEENEVPEPDD